MKKFIAVLVLATLLIGFVVAMIVTGGLTFALTVSAMIAGIFVVAGLAAWAILALMGEI